MFSFHPKEYTFVIVFGKNAKLDKYLIWPPFKGHNSKSFHFPGGKHIQIESILFAVTNITMFKLF